MNCMMINDLGNQNTVDVTTGSGSPFVIKVKKNANEWRIESDVEDSQPHKTDGAAAVIKQEVEDIDFTLLPPTKVECTAETPTADAIYPKISQKSQIGEGINDTEDAKTGTDTGQSISKQAHQNRPTTISRRYDCNLCRYNTTHLLGFLNHVMKYHYASKTTKTGAKRCHSSETEQPDNSFLKAEQNDLSADLFNPPSQKLRKNVLLPSAFDAPENTTAINNMDLSVGVQTSSDQTENNYAEMPVMLEYHSKHVPATNNSAQELVAPISQITAATNNIDSQNPASGNTEEEQDSQISNVDPFAPLPASPKLNTVVNQTFDDSVLNESNSNNKTSSLSICSSASASSKMNKDSRGAKLNSIVNNLKEFVSNTFPPFIGQPHESVSDKAVPVCSNCGIQTNARLGLNRCHFCVQKYPQIGAKRSNMAAGQIFQHPNNGKDSMSNGEHAAFNHSVPLTYTRDKAIFPPNNQTMTNTIPSNLGQGIGFSQNNHFEDLQSLMQSGRVTMPDPVVLQSINCSQGRWNYIQEILHEAFSVFPYLTHQETQTLTRLTGLLPKQIKTLFAVARLQHGISWEQHEIESARRSLSNISRDRFQTSSRVQSNMQSPPPALKQAFQHFTKEQHDILRWSFTSIPLNVNELNRLHEVTTLDKATILHYFKQLNSHMSPTESEVQPINNKQDASFS
uniref:uncharacterized protein LOC120330167 n=1 Tax=Styela clava TaxID=7725 RepID=UPI001939EE08|nr:uncharacterized protein LOC120330167 [Styela clava]